MPSTNHHHRAGSLRQSNKKNKRTKSSKRSIKGAAGGRISVKLKNGLASRIQSKSDRRHMQKQKRDASKQALLMKKRGQSANNNNSKPPKIVGIISLGEYETSTEEHVRTLLIKDADKVIRNGNNNDNDNNDNSHSNTITAKYNVHKKDGTITYLTNSTAFRSHYGNNNSSDVDGAVLAALDLCRVCDVILFVIDGNGPEEIQGDGHDGPLVGMHIGGNDHDDKSVRSKKSTKSSSSTTTIGRSYDHLISERGDRILEAVKAQGLPTPITVLAHTMKGEDGETTMAGGDDHMTVQSTRSVKSIRRGAFKRRAELKRYATRFATTEFGVDHNKVMEIDLTVLNNDDNNDDDMKDDTIVNTTTTTSSSASSASASAALIRTICNMSSSPPKWVSNAMRSYLVSDSHRYNKEKHELQLTGYVRGIVPFNVNSLIHIPNLGTFGCKYVQKATHGLKEHKTKKKNDSSSTSKMEEDDTNTDVLWSNPSKRESLEMFATPDSLEGEQNLVGFDEHDEDEYLDDDDDADGKKKDSLDGVERPAGWSDYQSAWLDAVDLTNDDATAATLNNKDHGELAKALNQKSDKSVGTTAGGMDLDDDDNEVSNEERKALLEQRKKDHKDELEFPDEVEIDESIAARDRFARYRSLKSFRKSYWDPKENLPLTYSSVYHFKSFKGTQRDVIADMKDTITEAADESGNFWGCTTDDNKRTDNNKEKDGEDDVMRSNDDDDEEYDLLDGCIPTGSYVTVVIEKVSPILYDERISPKALLTAVTLLPHENKVSVLHMGLSSHGNTADDNNDLPMKSKDVLTFRCGWRTWKARPVFSQNNLNSDKHKFERFLPQSGSFFAASVFGPVTYTPCPVMVFRNGNTSSNTNISAAESIGDGTAAKDDSNNSKSNMVALGSMIGADADRIIIKRIILTGYPVRVHKRHATVKYMFYNPDDVVWFKPAELTTKHGLHGNIIESVGEHGTMKCLFNAPIKQHDTVCLPLYKRIYPKFANDDDGGDTRDDDNGTKRTIATPSKLVVL